MKKLFGAIAGLLIASAALAQSIPFPGPGGVSITPLGTPVTLGSTTSTASASTVALTASAAIQGGDLVVCTLSNNGNWTTVSLSDGTNTYALVAEAANNGANNNRMALWYKANAAAVASPTITATFSASGTSAKSINCARVAGATTSPLDVATSAVNAGGNVTINTGTLAQAIEVIFAGCTTNGTTFTAASGFTRLSEVASGVFGSDIEYQVVASTSSVAFTISTGGPGTGCPLGSFKGN